jgi:hypothetical protein
VLILSMVSNIFCIFDPFKEPATRARTIPGWLIDDVLKPL